MAYIGMIVHYEGADKTGATSCMAAIVSRVYGDQKVDLHVFNSMMKQAHFVYGVPRSDAALPGTWHTTHLPDETSGG